MNFSVTIVMFVLLLGGCGVHVKYDKPYEDESGLVKFRLVGSLLTVAAKASNESGQGNQTKKDVKNADELQPPVDVAKAHTVPCSDSPITNCLEGIAPIVTPVYGSELIAVRVHDVPWRRTTLSATYLDRQPHLLKELGVDVTDYSVEAIGAIAAIAKTAIGFGALGATSGAERPPPSVRELRVPAAIDVSDALRAGEAGTWTLLPNNDGWWYKLEKVPPSSYFTVFSDGKPSGSTVAAQKYFGDFREGGLTTATSFPVSSCTAATLTLMFLPGANAESVKATTSKPPDDSTLVITSLLVADPRFVETFPIPEKGSIKFKGVCGADVDAKPSGVASGWKVLQTIADQAKAVHDAQKTDPTKAGKSGTAGK